MKKEHTQSLIRSIAEKNNISIKDAKLVITSAFKLSYITMTNTGGRDNNWDFKSVFIPFFGSFRLVKSRIKAAKNKLRLETLNKEEDGK